MGDDPLEMPEWIVVSGEVRALVERFRRDVADATERFRSLTEVEEAIAFRERQVPRLRARLDDTNIRIAHLNLIAPRMRFQRAALDPESELAALARTYFQRSR
jgi:hypothetical protein